MVTAQFSRALDQLEGRFPATAKLLCNAEMDLLAFATFPVEHWPQIWFNKHRERLNREVRRGAEVVRIFLRHSVYTRRRQKAFPWLSGC